MRQLNIPLIGAGKITPELAEELISEHKADFIALGRPLFADPDLPNKLHQDQADQVRPCIYCNNCLRLAYRFGAGVCSVNPFLFNEKSQPYQPVKKGKTVIVGGGGVAGMQAALYSAIAGHQVHLHEKTDRLGGLWNSVAAAADKQHYTEFSDYLKRMLDKEEVPIFLNSEINTQAINEINPDAVIVATGAQPTRPEITGINKPHVINAVDALNSSLGKQSIVKGKVVVIGARLTAIEVAAELAKNGENVCLVGRTQLGGNNHTSIEDMSFRAMVKELIDYRVPLYLNAEILEITEHAVFIKFGEHIYSLPADTVVLATGMTANNVLTKPLKEAGIKTYIVGDCIKPEDAAQAAFQAARVAESL